MSARLLSNENGVEEWFDYDPITDTCTITQVQDTTAFTDAMNEKRKQENWSKEVKNDFVHFCSIPPIVEVELMKKGINMYDKNCTKRLMQEIQTNYPYLLAHHGKRLV